MGNDVLKVAMYLQTDELKNKVEFEKVLPVMRNADADIVVFPETCYVPFVEEMIGSDILNQKDMERAFLSCLELSESIGKAVIVSSYDVWGTIFSIFANFGAGENETKTNLYIKHTMTEYSCLDLEDYADVAACIFDPILIKNFLVGMTICYDCNHALFSRIYGYYGIDLIINSTGGDVIYDKWFKYNKVRAIENRCSTLVTMGGDGRKENSNNYVLGFNGNGGMITPINLNGCSDKNNCPGGLYLYEIAKEPGMAEPDKSNLTETENKNWQMEFPVGKSADIIKDSKRISDMIYCKKIGNENVVFLLVDGMDILKPEIVQPLLYSDIIKNIPNRRYIIINRHDTVDEKFFIEKLSIVLKVRSMENFCAVILESQNINKCYQCGKNRTAQVVKVVNEMFRIDLERTSGPEAIWKNKQGMRASWRKNYEWLVNNAESIYKEQ